MIDYILIPEEKRKILKKKKEWVEELEKTQNVKIKMNEEILIEGDDLLSILKVKNVLKAIGRGFDWETAKKLLDDEYYLEIIDLKDYSRSRNKQIIMKGRVIGREGKFKRLIEEDTKTKLAVYGKTVSIIGKPEHVKIAARAVKMILEGKKHSTVMRFLARNRVE